MCPCQTEGRIRGKEGKALQKLQRVWAPGLKLQEQGRKGGRNASK